MSLPRVVLLTGASTGIGLALSQLLWQSEFRVAITARETSIRRLRELRITDNERLLIRALDINNSSQRESLIAEINSLWGGVDVLVNNAGISYRSVVEHMSEEDELFQMQTNYLSPFALIRLVLPHMRSKGSGHIINVSSVGGMMAMPTMGSYSASKFALEGASEALWYELKPWGVNVSLIQPGFIHSNSFRNVYLSKKAKAALAGNDDYSHYYHFMSEFIAKLMTKAIATPESIAAKILQIIKNDTPPLRVPATIDAYFFSVLRRVLPRRAYHSLLFRGLPHIKNWRKGEKTSP